MLTGLFVCTTFTNQIKVKKIAFGNKEHITDRKRVVSVLFSLFISSNKVCNTAYALQRTHDQNSIFKDTTMGPMIPKEMKYNLHYEPGYKAYKTGYLHYWMRVQQRLRSTCASSQADQSLRCPPEDALYSWLPIGALRRLWPDCADP